MAALTSQPVRRLTWPDYPTRLQVVADAELLRRHMPPGWVANREIAAAAGVFLAASVVGCGDSKAPALGADASSAAAALVAPIFEHGDGNFDNPRPYGFLGCVAVTAPVYLSEEEALGIIAEELGRAGLSDLARNVTLDGVIIRGHTCDRAYNWVSEQRELRYEETSGPLVADLVDPQRHICVEFLSKEDYYPLGGEDTGELVSQPSAGRHLAEEVQQQAIGIVFGVFYDPVVSYNIYDAFSVARKETQSNAARNGVPEEERADPQQARSYARLDEALKHYEDGVREKSRELLRLQVKDFVEWLKAQGVI